MHALRPGKLSAPVELARPTRHGFATAFSPVSIHGSSVPVCVIAARRSRIQWGKLQSGVSPCSVPQGVAQICAGLGLADSESAA